MKGRTLWKLTLLAAPLPANETERLTSVRANLCAYAPREERFDRITRTARRLLQVPIALISIIEEDEQWFRSVQGLEVYHTARDISFCGHAIALNKPLCIPDTWADADFADNPLVIGPPGIRAYLGWPLELSPGVVAGSLCVIDTMPRTFGPEDFEALSDLAAMAEAELRVKALSGLQNKLVTRLDALQRKGSLDPLTGCWNIRGFRELMTIAVEDAREQGTDLAICTLQVNDLGKLAADAGYTNPDALTLMLAQVLRQRLPHNGVLARLGPAVFCALVPAASALALEAELARLSFPQAVVNLPDGKLTLALPLAISVSWLADLESGASASTFWARSLQSPVN